MKLGEPAVGSLIEALEEKYNINSGLAIKESVTVRGSVAEALSNMGEEAAGPLVKALEDKNKYVREAAKTALEKIRAKKG